MHRPTIAEQDEAYLSGLIQDQNRRFIDLVHRQPELRRLGNLHRLNTLSREERAQLLTGAPLAQTPQNEPDAMVTVSDGTRAVRVPVCVDALPIGDATGPLQTERELLVDATNTMERVPFWIDHPEDLALIRHCRLNCEVLVSAALERAGARLGCPVTAFQDSVLHARLHGIASALIDCGMDGDDVIEQLYQDVAGTYS